MGTQDRRPRHLPRSRALQRQPFRQDQWLALVEPDAVEYHSLRPTGLGVAGDDGFVALGTLLPAARTPPADAVGAQFVDAEAAAPLAASASLGGRRRQRLCRAG